MILYIHGFGSSGNSNKGRILKEYFGNSQVLCPTLAPNPHDAIKSLEEIISTCKKPLMLAGSSLGGYYGTYLSNKYELPCVLVNPAVKPYETLKQYIGEQKFYGSEETFLWTKEDIEALKCYEISQLNKKLFLLMQQIGDELLDYNEAVTKYTDASILLLRGGSHQFDDFEKYCFVIKYFYMKQFNITSL